MERGTPATGVIGYFFVDHVIGKHLYIDYSVALGADGRVRRVEPARIWRRPVDHVRGFLFVGICGNARAF
jgi:hypothetical protein